MAQATRTIRMNKKQARALLKAFRFHGQGILLQHKGEHEQGGEAMDLRDEAMIEAGLPNWKTITRDIANEDGPFAPRP